MRRNTLYTWVWQDVVRDLAKQNEFFTICQTSNVKRVLCAFYEAFDAGNEFTLIRSFIDHAHSLGIEIFGIPSVLATDLNIPTNTRPQIVNMLNYNSQNPTAKFDGIQFDVESPGWGLANLTTYVNYFRTVKTFTNNYGETLITQGMRFAAYLDAPQYLKGSDGAAGFAKAIELYKEMSEIDIVGYETTLAALITHLADGPAVCQTNGIIFRPGFELSKQGNYGEIGQFGLDYFLQFANSVDTQFASFTYYGGYYIEQYSSLKVLLEDSMNIFVPGEPKTAIVPLTVTPAGQPCTTELFLGLVETVPVVTSGKVAFNSTGTPQNITLPVTMPTAPGTYHVYIDVYMGGSLIKAYQATEDVIIPGVVIGPPVWS
jgi:hypothetical protein